MPDSSTTSDSSNGPVRLDVSARRDRADPGGPMTSIGGRHPWEFIANASTPQSHPAVRPQTTVPGGTTFATAAARSSSVSGTPVAT